MRYVRLPGLPSARVVPLLTHEGSRDRYNHQAEFVLTKLEIARPQEGKTAGQTRFWESD
jgi:hypothetical protein